MQEPGAGVALAEAAAAGDVVVDAELVSRDRWAGQNRPAAPADPCPLARWWVTGEDVVRERPYG